MFAEFGAMAQRGNNDNNNLQVFQPIARYLLSTNMAMDISILVWSRLVVVVVIRQITMARRNAGEMLTSQADWGLSVRAWRLSETKMRGQVRS